MKAEYILQADLLDIIFENRNKDYGAYELRRHYETRVIKALGMIILLLAIFSLYNLSRNDVELPFSYIFSDDGIVTARIREKEIIIAPAKQKTPVTSKKVRSSGIIKIVDSTTKTAPLKNSDSTEAGRPDVGNKEGPEIISPAGTGEGAAIANRLGTTKEVVKPPGPDIPVTEVDIMPSYPGGMKALTRFLERNLHNPVEMTEGSVIPVSVRFVVGFDGLLKKFEIIKNGGAVYNEEVIRVLKKMPAWIPGVAKGENVSVYYTIPVKFVAPE